MRVLICPDKFAGTLSARQAAAAIADGWRDGARAGDDLDLRPLSDGGPGFVDVLDAALSGKRLPVATVDPLGRPVRSEILIADDIAYVESAHACGLHLLSPAERDPKVTTSYGLGTLISAAVDAGASEIVIGLGGSATNDAGAGMLAALGAVAVDASGQPVPRGGAALAACTDIVGDLTIPSVRLVGATDVDSPLTGIFGATAVYGPQKGATREDVLLLDAALERFAAVLSDGLPGMPGQSRIAAGSRRGRRPRRGHPGARRQHPVRHRSGPRRDRPGRGAGRRRSGDHRRGIAGRSVAARQGRRRGRGGGAGPRRAVRRAGRPVVGRPAGGRRRRHHRYLHAGGSLRRVERAMGAAATACARSANGSPGSGPPVSDRRNKRTYRDVPA